MQGKDRKSSKYNIIVTGDERRGWDSVQYKGKERMKLPSIVVLCLELVNTPWNPCATSIVDGTLYASPDKTAGKRVSEDKKSRRRRKNKKARAHCRSRTTRKASVGHVIHLPHPVDDTTPQWGRSLCQPRADVTSMDSVQPRYTQAAGMPIHSEQSCSVHRENVLPYQAYTLLFTFKKWRRDCRKSVW